MFDNIVLVREINAILKYSPNKNDNSFYKTYKMPKNELDRQIRVSSHGTYLKFWVEQDYNPSFGINLSIVFTSNGIPTNDCIIDSETNEISKDCNPCIMNQDLTGNICKPRHVQGYNQKKRPFYVTQYVYNCENFDGSELNALIVAIKTASQTGIYNDPFADIESKKAIETKLYPKDRENENKTYKTMKQKIRLTESQLHNVIRRCINEALEEMSQKTSLKEYMKMWYDNDDSCQDALNDLTDEQWLHSMGWFQVFHEGIGNGVCSPSEKIVAVFDEDDLPMFHSYQLYRYNPKAWVSVENDGWDKVYNGENGDDYDVEPID